MQMIQRHPSAGDAYSIRQVRKFFAPMQLDVVNQLSNWLSTQKYRTVWVNEFNIEAEESCFSHFPENPNLKFLQLPPSPLFP